MMDQRSTTALLLLLVLGATHAFVAPSSSTRVMARFGLVQQPVPYHDQTTRLFAEEEEEAQQEEEAVDGEPEDPEASAEEQEPEEKEEDPEVKAIKEEIASLETKLKTKRREVQQAKDLAEIYTKAGYARKVAEMENMRKARRSLQSFNKYTSQAAVVQSFLPVLDELRSLRETYADDEFGQKYDGLTGAFNSALKELHVEEYTAEVGEPADARRVLVKEEEYSDEFEKGTVIRPLTMGMELQGNVMRMAECVASLGIEADAKAAEEAAEEEEEEEEESEAEEEESEE